MPEPAWLAAAFPYEVHRTDVPGGTMAWAGSGRGPRDVVCIHGNPTWSVLWRRVMSALADAPLRVLAPDLLGYGRSSKPAAAGWHSVEAHAASLAAWMDGRALRDPLLVVQDWGGPIGVLAAARAARTRVSGLVLMNTAVVLPARWKSTAFHRLARTPVLAPLLFGPLGFPLRSLHRVQGDPASIRGDVARAYRWPFRESGSRAAPLALARLVPDGPDHRSVPALREVDAWVRAFPGPVELVWGVRDPILGRALRRHRDALPRARVTETSAGHFLQEEVPDVIARSIRALAGV